MSTIITKGLNNLKEQDWYSMALFCLYKLIEVPEYSSLGELPYVLDKENLLNLCEYFGGQTIKIPMRARCESLNAAAAAAVVLWEMARSGREELDLC